MRLKKIYISNYKNLKDFSIDFAPGNGLSMLIGNNGTGKSNVLEAISGIFHDLFKEKDGRKIACNYLLEYEMDGKTCILKQESGTLRCFGEKFKSRDAFIRENAPNSIIGLYSGEEDRLWTHFYETYYKAYIRRIKTNQPLERMRLLFINKYYWNIALLTMLLSENETIVPFVRDELNIVSVKKVVLHFDFHAYENANELLKAFIDRINREHKAVAEYTFDELKNLIYVDQLCDKNGALLLTADNKRLLVKSGISDLEVFRYLTQAYMPKNNKTIKSISIYINNGITVRQLSEGEKKLILVKTALEILADEKSLLLMDEPDAHLHEERKKTLYDMMHEYPNRQVVLTTHSPMMAQHAKEDELIMLDMDTVSGNSHVLSSEKREKIQQLTGSIWDVVSQNIVLRSNRPLVIFEGKTDVLYVKQAIKMLGTTRQEYNSMGVDFLNANGADNVKSFMDNLLDIVPHSKKIITFFDRDFEGRKGASAVAGISADDERIVHYKDIFKDNVIISFIPYADGVNSGDFLIEDYFLWENTIHPMIDELVPDKKNIVKLLPNLPKRLKSEIENRYLKFQSEEFLGFVPLLEKISSLSKGMEGQTTEGNSTN